MATKTPYTTLTNSSVDVINAIRNSASINYQNYVPVATANADSIKAIGTIIMDNPAIQNEFINALINRIGRVIVTSKIFNNPLNVFKKGLLDFGETIEDIFVNIAKPFQYDPETAENTVFKREIPDVKSAFHIMNYQKFYKITIEQEELRLAFLSWSGVTDLITRITDSVYSAATYDEFQVTKYMIAKNLLDGNIITEQIPEITSANMTSIVSTIKGVSNDIEFPTTKYNRAGVLVNAEKRKGEQYFIVNSKFDAKMDVEVLASAFNMSKAEFVGKRVLIDSFGSLDTARLNTLFAGDPNYTEIGSDDLAKLDSIPCMIVSDSYFMIFDNLIKFTENYNGQGLYWNYFLHTWKTFSVSPFGIAVAFTDNANKPNLITVTGDKGPFEGSTIKGKTIQFTAKVSGPNADFVNQAVNWSIDHNEYCTIDQRGLVTFIDNISESTTIMITVKSAYYDNVQSGTMITIQ